MLYSLEPEAAKACLKEAHRVLKPGGELRFSEPKKGNKLSKVLDQIWRDLKGNNRYSGLEREYNKVRQINELALAPLLHRWSLEEVQETLRREIGFTEITYATDNVYAGQSMLVCAQKRSFSGRALILLSARNTEGEGVKSPILQAWPL